MPIDSICTGCGKTLRVGDEFAGRKARCPLCGAIYVVGGDTLETTSTPMVAPLHPLQSQQPQSDLSSLPAFQSSGDSWSSMPTSEPLPSAPLANAQPIGAASSNPATYPAATSFGQASSPAQSAPGERYFVRTPNGVVYGPSDVKTVNDWIQQGRLDDTCHIRSHNSEQWIGIPAWQFQLKRTANPVMGYGSTASATNQFGAAPVSSNQSAGYVKSGNGIWVLLLGIFSWILCVTFIGGIICSILAIVLGINELSNIRNGKSPESDRAFALIGMWLGILNLVCTAGVILLVIVLSIVNP
jgi:hypothetical protein